MKNFIFTAMLFMTSSVFATSGSLWCSLSSYGTPTETLQKGATPYALIQVDEASDKSLQLHIEDFYHSTEDIFIVNPFKSMGHKISEIVIGSYHGEKEVEINMENGRIIMTVNGVKFFCEIPGNYKSDYSKDIKKI